MHGVHHNDELRLKERQELIVPPPIEEKLANTLYLKLANFLTKPQQLYTQQINDYASKCLYFLSVTNYEVIVGNVIQHMLPQVTTTEEEIVNQLTQIGTLNWNYRRLTDLFTKISKSHAAYKKINSQQVLARVLRKAIWSWINDYPLAFVSLCQSGGRMQGMIIITNRKQYNYL